MALALLATPMACVAADLRVSYHLAFSTPYVIVNGLTLTDGLMKDIGDAVASVSGLSVSYHVTSRARLESEIIEGRYHMTCLIVPAWFREPARMDWSIPLITENERYLIPKQAADIVELDDLNGLMLGLIKNFRYPTLEKRIADGQFIRDNSADFHQALKKLKFGRVDAMLIKDLQLNHLLKHEPDAQRFKLATRVESRNELQCAISRHLPFDRSILEHAFQQLKESGQLERIAAKYR